MTSNKQRIMQRNDENLSSSSTVLGVNYARVMAPMINQSDAPFRSLCLRYGATCVYSEMLFSSRIIDLSEGYLDKALPAIDHAFNRSINDNHSYPSRPLVAQICGNDPLVLAEAAKLLVESGKVDGIDFNLGCPQDRAKKELFGSYLLDYCHWERVFTCVSAMSKAIDGRIPLSCKIRICERGNAQPDACIEPTIAFCQGLIDNGANLICIHGRTRGSTRFRRCGPANWNLVKTVAERLHAQQIPVLLNGNITTRHDVLRAMASTSPVAGVMSAEGLLADPALFVAYKEKPAIETTPRADRCQLFHEYCELSRRYQLSSGWDALESLLPTCTTSNESIKHEQQQKDHNRHQMYVAKQHLMYMLGKSGHGRTVRFQFEGAHVYKKHVHVLNAINAAATLDHLKEIAVHCLVGVYESNPFSEDD